MGDILQTSEQTNGRLLQIEYDVAKTEGKPVPVTRMLIAMLGGNGRLLSHKAKYEKYSA